MNMIFGVYVCVYDEVRHTDLSHNYCECGKEGEVADIGSVDVCEILGSRIRIDILSKNTQ